MSLDQTVPSTKNTDETSNTIKDSEKKFHEYLKNKYKTDETVSRTFSYIVPVIIAFIGAYALLIESLANIFITLAKENSITPIGLMNGGNTCY